MATNLNPGTDRRGIVTGPGGKHVIDRDLPGHWEGIRVGQTREERTAAIVYNVRRDKSLRKRGVDPATGGRLETRSPSALLERIEALRK